jgi:hypothetical protein
MLEDDGFCPAFEVAPSVFTYLNASVKVRTAPLVLITIFAKPSVPAGIVITSSPA